MRLAGTICGRAIRTGARWWPTAQGPAVVCAACQAAWCRTAWSVVPWGCVGCGAAWCLGVGWVGVRVAWRVALGLIKSLLWLPFGQEYSGIVTGQCGRAVRRGCWGRAVWLRCWGRAVRRGCRGRARDGAGGRAGGAGRRAGRRASHWLRRPRRVDDTCSIQHVALYVDNIWRASKKILIARSARRRVAGSGRGGGEEAEARGEIVHVACLLALAAADSECRRHRRRW